MQPNDANLKMFSTHKIEGVSSHERKVDLNLMNTISKKLRFENVVVVSWEMRPILFKSKGTCDPSF